jgi:DNA-binding MarR family transcriptional regulator
MLSALSTLEREGPMTLGALAAAEGVRPPSMTRIIARLEEDGLAAREPYPQDRRVTRVRLTSAGRALVRHNRTRKDAYLVKRIRALPRRDAASLVTAVEVIESLLEGDDE